MACVGPPANVGNVLAVGGANAGDLASAEVYNPATGTWTPTNSLATARADFQMVLLPSGNVLATGGYNDSNGFTPIASTEVYSPAMGTWTATDSLTTARSEFSMVLLLNGNVLAAGGDNASAVLTSAEVYSLTMGTWTSTDSLATARENFRMVLLPDGNVLAAGGSETGSLGGGSSNYLASAELYSPIAGTWTATGSLQTAREYFQMVLLPDGNVLAAGGYSDAARRWAPGAPPVPLPKIVFGSRWWCCRCRWGGCCATSTFRCASSVCSP